MSELIDLLLADASERMDKSVESIRQKFGTVTTEFDPFHQTWVFDAYLFDETNGGETERRSVGFQTRYSRLGSTAVMLIDYDIAFKQFNSVTLIGNTKVGQYWVLSVDVDHRRSPLLELSNALIGQSVLDLRTLETQLTPSPVVMSVSSVMTQPALTLEATFRKAVAES